VVVPVVNEVLEREGFRVAGNQPRLVTRADITNADLVVTMGCDLETFGVLVEKRRDWSDVPPASANVIVCRRVILTKVLTLLFDLSRAQHLCKGRRHLIGTR
jgi:hypothetical protein